MSALRYFYLIGSFTGMQSTGVSYRSMVPLFPRLEAPMCTNTTGQAIGEAAFDTTVVLVGDKVLQKVWQGGRWVRSKRRSSRSEKSG